MHARRCRRTRDAAPSGCPRTAPAGTAGRSGCGSPSCPRATGRRSPDALLYLAGGPGGSAIADAAGVRQLFSAANEARDIVLLDQRGTGASNRLDCPLAEEAARHRRRSVRAYVRGLPCALRRRRPAVHDRARDGGRRRGRACARLRAGGRLRGLVRSHRRAYLLAQHPELVRTAILDGGTLLDVPIFELWARNGEHALRSILSRCATSPRCARAYPRVRSEVFEMMGPCGARPSGQRDHDPPGGGRRAMQSLHTNPLPAPRGSRGSPTAPPRATGIRSPSRWTRREPAAWPRGS